MIKTFAGYTSDGAIRNIMHCNAIGPTYEDDTGLSVAEIGNEVGIDTHYIEFGAAKERRGMRLITTNTPLRADGIDEVIVSGIPEGVTVEWPDDQTDVVPGGEVRFSVDLPGTYTLTFTAVPYLDQEVVIEALAAT